MPILVIDSVSNGTYDIVIPDINRNGNFSDDEWMVKGNETAGLDENGDGIRDVSAGLLYWISDGVNGVPYGAVYSCLLYTSPSPRDQRGSRMPSSA